MGSTMGSTDTQTDRKDAEVAARALDLIRGDSFPFTEPVDRLAEILHRGLFGDGTVTP